LASIVANDYPRDLIDIIVVDNESSDGFALAAVEAGATVLSCGSRSVAELRNKGAGRARGNLLAFVDADHQIDRGWTRAAIDMLSTDGVGATGAPYQTDPSPNWVQRQYDAMRSRLSTREEVSWLGSGNLIVRKTAFDDVKGFDEGLSVRGRGPVQSAAPGRSSHRSGSRNAQRAFR
jgi:mycofactocin glycosyltransferase